MSSPQAVHKTVEVRRPRSSQHVSVSWEEPQDSVIHHSSRLQFEVAECVETKTITTTTTTKRSYPPLFVREPRQLSSLDSKEYPLASRPIPTELKSFTLDLDEYDGHAWSFEDEPESTQTQVEQSQNTEFSTTVKSEPGIDSPKAESSRRVPNLSTDVFPRRSPRSSTRAASPSQTVATRSSQRASRHGISSSAVSDKLRRAVTQGSRKEAGRSSKRISSSSDYLATPDTSEVASGVVDRSSRLRLTLDTADSGTSQSTAGYDAASPTASESHTIFSSSVATPPITDADLQPYNDADEALQQTFRTLQSRPSISTVAVQDASLPSPRLSPTLAAAQLSSARPDEDGDEEDDLTFSQQVTRRHRSRFFEESQTTDDGDLDLSFADQSPMSYEKALVRRKPMPASLGDTRSMLESFDALPNEMKSFMMYQFLRRCPRKTLHMVADVVNPALKCDFLKTLPTELSLHVLSFLNHRDLCRAAQVSKHWRNLIDGNETGWKELFDRDGFELTKGELNKAITQGWGWQDPVGAEGCEIDLSVRNKLTSSETDLIKLEQAESSRPSRAAKRKRTMGHLNVDRAKRRASGQDLTKESKKDDEVKMCKSEGPNSSANQAAIAVPDPQLGLASLRKLHLFKSLYRRHYMIRQSWTSGKVKPEHVAFAAHPRHVITCLQFDDDKIITGSDDTLIHVYDTKTGKLRKKLEGHEGGVWALQYHENTLVSGSTDRSVRVWDIAKGICTQTFFGHTSTVRCLQILLPTDTGKVQNGQPVMMPPKPLIITGSRDSQLRVWRLPDPKLHQRYIQTGPPANDDQCPFFVRILSGHAHSVRAISAHADTLVSGSYDSTVRVWRISTGEQLHVLHGHSQKVYSVVLDHKRNRCISGSMDSLVKIWDLDTGACLHTLEGHSLLVGLLDLRDEKLVSAAADSTLRIWDPENGKCKSTLMAHTGAITCFQHDGRKVISGSEKTVKMWDIQTGDCIQDLLTDLSGVWQVKFDERRCVAAVQRDSLTYVEVRVDWRGIIATTLT
ncbi:WD40 repeat-like protein [Thozetella sp. PMI_491]|nr:WD40 repeat-like protein [Thozetella sp. PMI_491]